MITKKYSRLSDIEGVDLTGKIIVVDEGHLAPQYRSVEHQLYRATGGFGCMPFTRGTAVFCESLTDQEKLRWERYNIIGTITEETAKELLHAKEITD